MAKRLNATISKETKQLLINDFGYEPVDLESYTGQIRALKESFNSLQIKDPKDPRLMQLQIAVKDLRADREIEKDDTGTLKRNRKRRKDAKSLEQIQAEIDAKDKAIADRKAKKKKDAMNFISPGSAPAELPPAESDDGGDMSSVLSKIAGDVNIIKGIVASQESIEKDKLDDTREAREKKKRSLKENLLEGGKKMYDKVAGTFGKVLEPAKGIFESIFNFIKLFLLGSALMKILDWFGNPANKDKIQSIFRFLKDFWPVIAAGVIALMGPIPSFVAALALAFGFVPKIIDFVKSIFGLGKDVDKEIKKEEKDYEKNTRGSTSFDVKDEDLGSDSVTATPVDSYGEPTIGGGEGTTPQQMNQGGEVPGQGNTDTVPAMLTPGEFVLTKEAVNQVGADTLYNINAAAGGVGKPSQQKQAQKKKKKKKTSTVGTMMNMGGLKMGGMTNNMSYGGGGVVNNMSYGRYNNGGVVNNMSYGRYNNGGVVNNMSYGRYNSGGLVSNMSYGSGGVVNNMSYAGGGQVPVQKFFMGGLVKKVGKVISQTPQARLLRFAANQVKKVAVSPPASRALKALKNLGGVPPAPSMDNVTMPDEPTDRIPSFDVIAPGGRAKELTLGIRR